MVLNFINFMRENLAPPDDKSIVDWLQLADELADANDTYIKQELELIEDSLKYVKNNFKPEVFQESLRFPTLCNEIVNAALCFNAGYSREETAEFADKGYFESGFIPCTEGERGTFTVVQITEPESSVTVCSKFSEEKLTHWIIRASIDKPSEDISDVLEECADRFGARITRLLNEPLQNAFVKAIEQSTCVKCLIKFNPVTGEIETTHNSGLINEECDGNIQNADGIEIRLN